MENYFSKIGISTTILPYLFKDYNEWGDFMWNICYSGRLSWYKFEMVYLTKFLSCDFNFDEEMTMLLSEQQIDNSPQLGSSYDLCLKPERGSRNVRDFLALAKSMRFDRLNSLQFTSMEVLDIIGTRYAAKFLKFSMPHSINEVKLECLGESTPYINSLCLLLPRVQNKIVLSRFTISSEDLIKVSTKISSI